MEKSEFNKALSYSLSLLSRREYSKYELLQKLSSKYSEDVTKAVIEYLTENNYQNDQRFTEMMIRYYSNKGYGLKKIVFELANKGIKANSVNTVIEDMSISWVTVAKSLIEKKYKNCNLCDYQEKKKILSYIVRRGFSISQGIEALKILSENSQD